MLKSIDILIGLSLVMLVASMATMLVTHALIGLAQRRGAHLLRGLTDLLAQLHPAMTPADAKSIAAAVLAHPLVRGSKRRRATVVKREEFIKLLFELAARSPAAGAATTPPLDDHALAALVTALKDNGVKDPAQTLSNVRMMALELERIHPELASAARQTLALTQEARSEFVAKINAWFDQTMDRVTERFTISSRAFTLAAAVAVVLVTQLDAVSVINRFAMDDQMRRQFVEEAMRVDEQALQAQAQNAAQPSASPRQEQLRLYRMMGNAGIMRVPGSLSEWSTGWGRTSPGGVLLSILLLTLGAPFWFNALSRLLRLRSVVAQKDDIDRAERQLDTSGQAFGGVSSVRAAVADASALSAVADERVDLAAGHPFPSQMDEPVSTDAMELLRPPAPVPPVVPAATALVFNRTLALGTKDYQPVATAKNLIVLHFTAGQSAKSAYETWKADPRRVATAYVVDRDGTICEMFDPRYWASHLGIKGGPAHDKRSIGIEIANVGPLERSASGTALKWWVGQEYCSIDDEERYCRQTYRGFEYYAAFPQPQVAAVGELVRHLTARFSIPKTLPPRHLRHEFDEVFFSSFKGIATHANFRKDKFDIGPAFDWDVL